MQLSARNISAWFVATLLIMFGFVRRALKRALKGEYILSVCFHKPSEKEFESCIKWLKKNNFHFLSTLDIERLIHDNLPFPKGAVLLTIDDGWQSNEENVVAIVNKYGVPITIFVSTAPVEEGVFWWSYWLNGNSYVIKNGLSVDALKKLSNKERLHKVEEMKKTDTLERNAMTVEQIKRVANSKYVTIGGHTHTHPILINCDHDEVFTELQLSKQKLEDWIGKEVAYFAYPNGDHGKREIQILKELNWRLAFNVHKKIYFTPDCLKDQYNIPRFSFLEGASFAENMCQMVGVWRVPIKWPKLNLSLLSKGILKLNALTTNFTLIK